MKLSEIIKKKYGFDYSQEIAELAFHQNLLRERLEKNRLLKKDRENLIEALQIIMMGEY